jgi:hypothetical protein
MICVYSESPIATILGPGGIAGICMVPVFPAEASALIDEDTAAYIVSEDTGDQLTS